jgi:acyl carrier protein
VLDQVLHLQGRGAVFRLDTPLLGSVPELDSMSVAGVIAALEDRFGFAVERGEIDGATFATLGSLVAFVKTKLDD